MSDFKTKFHPSNADGASRKPSEKLKKHTTIKSAFRTFEVMEAANQLLTTSVLEEFKDPIPPYEGKDAPTRLKPPPLGFKVVPTKSKDLSLTLLKSVLAGKEMQFRIATVLDMSSTGTGAINSTISCNTITSNAEFTALSLLFEEFFINKLTVRWQPVSRYNGPVGFAPLTNIGSRPMVCACLQHQQSAYTNMSGASNNYQARIQNSGDPFTYTWVNVEKKSSTVAVEATGPIQSWAGFGRIPDYTGTIQFISQSAPPALPTTQVLGTFMVDWDISVRVRL